MPAIEVIPRAINRVVDRKVPLQTVVISTGNQDKIGEYQAAGIMAMPGISVPEIQNRDPRVVVAQKAKDAWRVNRIPTVVEDTSLEIDALVDLFPGPYVKDWAATRAQRADVCRILTALHPDDARGATFRVLLAVYDGANVTMREGVTRGVIADAPRGRPDFGFDDILIASEEIADASQDPSGREPRTYGEMDLTDKNDSSARARALASLARTPFELEQNVFELPRPEQERMDAMRLEELVWSPQALRFAYSMEATRHMPISRDLAVGEFLPYHRIELEGGKVIQYKIDPDSADQGVVVLPSIDLKRDSRGKPTRMDVDITGEPVLLQMGPEQIRMALASRALEYIEMHSDRMHDLIRGLRDEKEHVRRARARSETLETMLGMVVETEKVPINGEEEAGFELKHTITQKPTKIVAAEEIAYDRESSLHEMRSRRKSRQTGIFIGTDYGPMSILGLGGMPPTTGSKDMLVLSAMGYGQCWIPRNGVYNANPELQLQLFKEAKENIEAFGLPKDIEKICISRIGLSVGCDDPEAIVKQVAEYYKAGGRSARIYTTNPDVRIVETAKAIRKAVNELQEDPEDKFLLAVGPIADIPQAKELIKKDADVGMFILGHGAGQQCTSLEGGGSANSIPLLYQMSLMKEFEDRLLFMEGGVGQQYGPLLGIVDGFSANGKVLGGAESTAGLYLLHSDGVTPSLPYSGSASPVTQRTEGYLDFSTAKRRFNAAGNLESNEGVPGFYRKPDWVNSSADLMRRQREIIGRALADQDADSLIGLRNNVVARSLVDVKHGLNLVNVSSAANATARSHRPNS